jgi:hypothetical protein
MWRIIIVHIRGDRFRLALGGFQRNGEIAVFVRNPKPGMAMRTTALSSCLKEFHMKAFVTDMATKSNTHEYRFSTLWWP